MHQWANSPDFPSDCIWWGRTIPSRCFECHTSYIGNKEPIHTDAFHQIDRFDHTHILYGIDCERCHGPAAAHVQYQTAHPEDHTAHDIVRFAALSRQQKLDMCAVCHSGTREMQRSGFEFRPGDTLSNFLYPESDVSGTASKMDVHGNQYQLMVASKCFMQTQTLECNTCHAVHQRERDKIQTFSDRCMNCHQPAAHPGMAPAGSSGAAHPGIANAGSPGAAPFCKLTTLPLSTLEKNCIDCHMPLKASRVITLLTASGIEPIANKVRNHLVAVYPDATRAFIDSLKAKHS